MPFRSPEGHVAAVRAQKSDKVKLEQFEHDESGPCGASDEADWNGRDNKHVPHDLHPEKLEGALVSMRQSA